jgi:hypothetical protein
VNGDYDVLLVKYGPAGGHMWSKRFGNAAEQLGSAVGVDMAGNIVLAGSFESAMDLGGGPLQSAGSFDYFLAKLGPDGAHLFSKRFGDGEYQSSSDLGLSVSASGDAALAGNLEGAVDFGGGALVSVGLNDSFIAGFGATGDHLFSKRFGDGINQRAFGVAHFDPGRVAFTGWAEGTLDVGGGPLVSAGAGATDLFLGAFEGSTGAHVWSNLYGDAAAQAGMRVARAPSNRLVVLGRMSGTMDLGSGPLTAVGTGNLFVATTAP